MRSRIPSSNHRQGDRREEGKPDRTFLNYYISVLPSTAVSARDLTDLAYKIIDLHGEEELQVDKYVRDMLPKAKTELDFNPIGI